MLELQEAEIFADNLVMIAHNLCFKIFMTFDKHLKLQRF